MTQIPNSYYFAYYVNDPAKPLGLYVVLTAASGGSVSVQYGNENKKIWSSGAEQFHKSVHQGWMSDADLLTEDEAQAIASRCGLELEAARAEIISGYTKLNKTPPNLIPSEPALSDRIAKIKTRTLADVSE